MNKEPQLKKEIEEKIKRMFPLSEEPVAISMAIEMTLEKAKADFKEAVEDKIDVVMNKRCDTSKSEENCPSCYALKILQELLKLLEEKK
jgi:hypothetical protein